MGEKNKGLTPGTVLHGAYRIERILGQGGFGITYLAYESRLDRYVAIKEFFPKDYCDREEASGLVILGTDNTHDFVEVLKAKFLREARYIAKLNHPGIIKIHTAFEENRTAYYVMDFIEGCSLSQLVKKRLEERKGPLPPEEALRYITLVGDALDCLHTHSMNHFDIKPANILVRKADDRPVLIDFGLSKQYDDAAKETTATFMGMSRGFAPMEQYVAGGINGFSPQTDIYSLAATLYYLLAGTVPPDAPSLAEQELIFPALIPESLIEPISKGMAWRRIDRQPTVPAFLDDLKPKETCDQPADDTRKDVDTEIAIPQKKEEAVTESYEEKPKRKYAWLWFVGAAVIGIAVWIFAHPEKNSDPVNSVEAEAWVPSPTQKEVEGFLWESPLGRCVYSGTVVTDEATGEQLPDGRGVAKILAGNYAGSTYDGEFIRGVFEGTTVYTYRNGDTFEGTFVNNGYAEGKYTIKESGEYFEGTFIDGNPDKGTWYDRKGNEIE